MKYLTVCSGIEVPSLAWAPLGWSPAGFSEIADFPAALLATHYPDVPNHGDFTRFRDWDIPDDIDLLFGSTPCQSYSTIGKRHGLLDHRGELTLSYSAAVNHWQPEWAVWENVPGILSDSGNAFGRFLGELCGSDAPLAATRWPGAGLVSGPRRTVAWRTADAQYWGVPQRRRRVFVVSTLGAGDWRCAAALFPIRESLSGNAPAQHRATPDSESEIPGGPGVRGGFGLELVPSSGRLSHCLNAGGMGRIDLETETMVGVFRDGQPVGVRRLTPEEVERIQGVPTGYTAIHGASDTDRYNAVGNAIAVPVLRWIGNRISQIHRTTPPPNRHVTV